MVRTKVFAGNLDFKTKESDLAKFFSTAGKVISANIITRGPRSLGYGFVEMDSEEDAQKAVQQLNKQELDGRPINVELAKPREETAPQDQQAQQTGSNAQNTDATRGGFRRGRGGRGRGFRRGRGGFRGGSQSFRGRRGGSFRGRGRGGRGRKGSQSNEPDNRTPSKTTLFVANLPFKMDDEGFGKSLKDAQLTFKNAYVVKNQRTGRNKGFGFIEFDNEADQQKSLQVLNKRKVEERELIVKVALTENPRNAEAKPEDNKNNTTTTATTTQKQN